VVQIKAKSQLCAHLYVNDTGIDGKQVFTGENYFTTKKIEVFFISLQINLFSFPTFEPSERISALIDLLSESNRAAAERFRGPRRPASGQARAGRAWRSALERAPLRREARDFRGGC
jgi:hypothetical protein